MYNTKFVAENGQEIYPGYLDREQRQRLKERFGADREVMWCGCRTDTKLFYRISEDLKIYPEHNNYKHDRNCSRYKNDAGAVERQTAYLINEEDGEVTAYVTFNPKDFELSGNEEKEQDNIVPEDEGIRDEIIVEKDEEGIPKAEKREPELTLPALIRSINVDAFTEKVVNNRKIDSQETFSKFVFHRMEKVRINKMRKKIGELSLEKDGVRFVYLPFYDIVQREERGFVRCYIQTRGKDGKIFDNLIFPETLEKAVKEFSKTYGIEPDENTMLAGFQYLKKRRGRSSYRVLGRVHLFQVSNLGIYCRSLVEQKAFDSINSIVKANPEIKFWIPPEDDSIGGIIQIRNRKKKILLLFRGKKAERITYDSQVYEPLVIDGSMTVTKELLYELLEE